MPAEFDCCECGVHVITLCNEKPSPPLCAWCLHHPGWHQVPELREIVGRGYDNLPPIEPKDGRGD